MREREDVLREFGSSQCIIGDDCKHAHCRAEHAMADEIVRLRARLAAATRVTETAAGREVTREGTVARFLRGIRDREAQGLTYWVVDDADTLRIDLHKLASAVARTVNNDPQTPEGSEPVSNAYQLSTAERAVIEAAKAYEKWMGNWHDYTVRSGDKPAKQQRALIDAVRALAAALEVPRDQ
jgi:hypothetical protein